jgi:hypothetical protein
MLELVSASTGSDVTAMVVRDDGNVGIGTTNPTSALMVTGGATVPGISIKSGGNGGVDPFRVTYVNGTEGDMFIVDDSGNVGIGTASPDYKLHVAGTIGLQVGNAKATIDTDTSGTLNLTANQNVVNAASEINFKAPLSTGSGTIGTWARIKSGEFQHAGRRQYDGVNLAGNALYRENFFRYSSYASATHVHLKTDIPWGTTTQMYSVKFTGHAYNEGKAMETNLVFYNYPPSSAPVAIGSTGTHSATVYESSDNKIVMRITVATYYISFTASQYVTAQQLVDFNITASAANNSATHYA